MNQNQIQADKFYPPRLNAEQTLVRSKLFSTLSPENKSFQFVILEAQAGQGKTTAVVQFLEHKSDPYVWFQMEKEDTDPISFMSALFNIFSKTIQDFSFDTILQQIDTGQAGMLELPSLLSVFVNDLETYLQSGGDKQTALSLVFDDLHQIMHSPYTMELLGQLLDNSPQGLSIFLLSRYPVTVKSKRIRSGESTLHLANADLAMTRDEILELLTLLLSKLPEPEVISKIAQQSAGWPMGVVLAAQHSVNNAGGWKELHPEARDYFTQELFSTFDADEKQTILRLALLEEIPLELGQRLCPGEDVYSLLHHLAQRNFFLRYLNDEGTHFGFHHYFLAFLRETAASTLSEEEQLSLRQKAAGYYMEHGMIGKALGSFLEARDYSNLEECFEKYGLKLVARNRYVTIGTILNGIPERIIVDSAWFSYFSGLVLQGNKPREALPHFQRARDIFYDNGDKRNELLVVGSIIYLYIIHSQELPRYKVVPLLENADSLFHEIGHELPPYYRITTANHIALGNLYFINNFERAIYFNKLVEKLVAKENLPNLLVESRGASGWTYALRGDFKKGFNIIEENYRLIRRKELGLLSRTYLYFLQICYIFLLGDQDNFIRQRDELIVSAGLDFIKTSFIYPFLIVYEIELSVFRGKIEHALKLVDEHKETVLFLNPGTFRGELFGWKGLLLALTKGEDGQLSEAILELEKWLEFGASPFHQSKALLLLGIISRLQGNFEQGLIHYNQAIDICIQIGLEQQLARAYFHRALLYDDMGEAEKATLDAVTGIRFFKEKLGYNTIFAFTPEMFVRVMHLTSGAGEKTFSNQYAWNLLRIAISDDHDIPALEMQILGGFSLSIRDKMDRVAIGDLSRNQRKFLGLLLQAPGFEISQIEIQTILWPDIGEVKARARFDTMMTRLRKLLSELVAPQKVSDYLTVRKGIISLKHCVVDAKEFCRFVDLGFVHLNKGEWWQASNNFTPALKLWQGEVVSGILEMDEFSYLVHDPLMRLVTMAEKWSPILIGLNRYEEAMAVCETAWRVCSDNLNLTRLLYDLYLKDGAVREARKVIDTYRSKSFELGLDEKDVETSIQNIISAEGLPT